MRRQIPFAKINGRSCQQLNFTEKISYLIVSRRIPTLRFGFGEPLVLRLHFLGYAKVCLTNPKGSSIQIRGLGDVLSGTSRALGLTS